jgi:competence ComEA-like helix-hairpin-helix protein
MLFSYNGLESQQKPHIENDARVEILLFLGIVFWCWLLAFCYQGKFFPTRHEIPWELSWNGKGLHLVQGRDIELADSEGAKNSTSIPAAVTPFLFLPIPVNFADAELLATISGIGPKMAAQIVKTRESKGLFTGPQDLLTVPGIGPSRMNTFAPQFSFSGLQ